MISCETDQVINGGRQYCLKYPGLILRSRNGIRGCLDLHLDNSLYGNVNTQFNRKWCLVDKSYVYDLSIVSLEYSPSPPPSLSFSLSVFLDDSLQWYVSHCISLSSPFFFQCVCLSLSFYPCNSLTVSLTLCLYVCLSVSSFPCVSLTVSLTLCLYVCLSLSSFSCVSRSVSIPLCLSVCLSLSFVRICDWM